MSETGRVPGEGPEDGGGPPVSHLRRGALLTALLALGLGGISVYRLASQENPGLPPSAAARAFPSCPDPVAIAWAHGGERLGCLSSFGDLLTAAVREAGCEPRPEGANEASVVLPRPAVGERLVLATDPTGGCVGAVEMLPGSSLVALGLPIDLNRASAQDLQVLESIGPTRAREVVAHREAQGPFASVESLLEVRGIGPVTLEAVRSQLTVAPEAVPRGR